MIRLLTMHCGIAIATGIAGLCAAPVAAQDAKPFKGFHVEALLGYDNVSSGIEGTDSSADGLNYGIGLGSDFQFGKVILGFGTEYAGSTIDVRGPISPLRNNELRPGGDFYVGVRLGYTVAPMTMLYTKVGYTSTKLRFRYDDALDDTFEDRPTVDGVRFGLGIEHMMNEHFFVRGEYRYSNYSSLQITDPDDVTTDYGIDVDRSQVIFGIGYKF